MSPWTATLCGVVLAYAGMAALCLAMDRHYGQVFKRREPSSGLRALLQSAGATLLTAALWASLLAWGSGVGWVVWLGCLTAGALLAAGLWSAWPRTAAALAVPGAAGGWIVLASAFF